MPLSGIPRLRGLVRQGEELTPLVPGKPDGLKPVPSNPGLSHRPPWAGRGAGATRGKKGGGAGATFGAAVALGTIPGTIGTATISKTDFGTPTAALLVGNTINTASGTLANNAQTNRFHRLTLGVTDGINQRVISHFEQDNYSGSLHSGSIANNANLWMLASQDGSVAGAADFTEFVEDGLVVNVTDIGNANGHPVGALLFKDTVEQAVGDLTGHGSSGASVTESLAFEANFFFFAGNLEPFNGSDGNARITYGFAAWDGTTIRQGCFGVETSFNGTSGAARGIVRDNAIWDRQSGPEYIELTAVDGSGFTLSTKGGNTSAAHMEYMALKVTDPSKLWVGVIDTPTTTGVQSYTGVGFEPKTLLLIPTFIPAVNTQETGDDAGVYGLAMFTADDTAAHSGHFKHNADPTKCADVYDETGITLAREDGTILLDASLDGFTADGFDLNFAVADGLARKWVAVAIG